MFIRNGKSFSKGAEIKIYLVGGYVRDELLHRPSGDKDFVVVGATQKELQNLGFKKVGKDFPVFLHPETNEEYAMARKEKKVSAGHDGFDFDFNSNITLKEDLLRRDLTINAIAKDLDSGELIDPYNGKSDIESKTLRHISEHFSEDPLRVLRVARFMAQLGDFTISPETIEIMKAIVKSGELESLSGERIFMELKKGLLSSKPSLFIKTLDDVGALEVLFPELEKLKGVPQKEKYHPEGDAFVHTLLVLDSSVNLSNELDIRFSCLVHDLGKGLTSEDLLPSHKGHEKAGLDPIKNLCERLKVPTKMRDLALKVCEYHLHCHKAPELRASTVLKLFKGLDVFRNPDILEKFLICCESDNLGKLSQSYPQKTFFKKAFNAINSLDTLEVTKKFKGKELGEQIDQLRIKVIKDIQTNFIWPSKE